MALVRGGVRDQQSSRCEQARLHALSLGFDYLEAPEVLLLPIEQILQRLETLATKGLALSSSAEIVGLTPYWANYGLLAARLSPDALRYREIFRLLEDRNERSLGSPSNAKTITLSRKNSSDTRYGRP